MERKDDAKWNGFKNNNKTTTTYTPFKNTIDSVFITVSAQFLNFTGPISDNI